MHEKKIIFGMLVHALGKIVNNNEIHLMKF